MAKSFLITSAIEFFSINETNIKHFCMLPDENWSIPSLKCFIWLSYFKIKKYWKLAIEILWNIYVCWFKLKLLFCRFCSSFCRRFVDIWISNFCTNWELTAEKFLKANLLTIQPRKYYSVDYLQKEGTKF